jgi:hypothetical protein
VRDNGDNARTSAARRATVPDPLLTIEAPAEGARVRGVVQVRAVADPERSSHAVAFERQVGDGAWTPIGTDDSSPAYVVFDDLAPLDLPTGTPIRYRATLLGTGATSAVRTVEQAAPPVTQAVVHYSRPAGDYADWGLHLWGDAIVSPTDWNAPLQRVGVDGFGARYVIELKDDTKPVNFIMHRPGGDAVPDTREPGGDRSFVPSTSPEVWLRQGDPAVYTTQPPTG